MPSSRPPVRVESEVGRLRRVLVHEPGPEVDRMVPRMMEELLFDDILFGPAARVEHRRFRRVLEHLGIQVLEAQQLLAEALEIEACRAWVQDQVFPHLDAPFRSRLEEASPSRLAHLLVAGARRGGQAPAASLEELFGVRPLPNWCFQRDTQVVLGDRVHISAMAGPARAREALLSQALFRFHPELAGTPILGEEVQEDAVLEGGDVLILSADVVAVGQSARTSRGGVDTLMDQLRRAEGGPRWLLEVRLPRERAYMHLDTLFTPVDRDAALVFPPVILPGHATTATVLEHDLADASAPPREAGDLLAALAGRGLPYQPILCGGNDPVDQQREQWTDGANALAVAPGVVVLYDRNIQTAHAMSEAGFQVITAEDLLLGNAEVNLDHARRVCILTPSAELSRARGGPHCLTHPLLRDPVSG